MLSFDMTSNYKDIFDMVKKAMASVKHWHYVTLRSFLGGRCKHQRTGCVSHAKMPDGVICTEISINDKE